MAGESLLPFSIFQLEIFPKCSYNDRQISNREIMHFLDKLDQLIASKHLLNHPFYKAWTMGTISHSILQEYAGQYYHHVKAFPTYLSAIHSRTDDAAARKILLQNLIEEEAGDPNHPDLWKQFAAALGVNEDQKAEKEIQEVISAFKSCAESSLHEGLGALYAYESQIPPICISKIDGLKKHYGMKDSKSYEYFHVHIAADKEHAEQERNLLSKHEDQAEAIIDAANQVLDSLWAFLTALYSKNSATLAEAGFTTC